MTFSERNARISYYLLIGCVLAAGGYYVYTTFFGPARVSGSSSNAEPSATGAGGAKAAGPGWGGARG